MNSYEFLTREELFGMAKKGSQTGDSKIQMILQSSKPNNTFFYVTGGAILFFIGLYLYQRYKKKKELERNNPTY